MKKDKFHDNLTYFLSIKPFQTLLQNGDISKEDYCKIDTILRNKYQPIFVSIIIGNSLDNNQT